MKKPILLLKTPKDRFRFLLCLILSVWALTLFLGEKEDKTASATDENGGFAPVGIYAMVEGMI